MGTSLKGYVPDIPAPVPLGYPTRDMGYGQISRLVPDDDATSQKRGFTGSMSPEEDGEADRQPTREARDSGTNADPFALTQRGA